MDPTVEKTDSSLFDSLVVHVSDTSFKREDREALQKLLVQNGAIVSRTINSRDNTMKSDLHQASHLICEVEDYDTIDYAQEFGLRIVSRDWIDKSLQKSKLLDDMEFLIDDDDVIYEYNKRKARLDRQKQKYGLCHADENEGVAKKLEHIKEEKGKLTEIDKECAALLKITTLFKDDKGKFWSKICEDEKTNMFFLAQVLVSKSDTRSWVWMRWGQIKTQGQSKAKEFTSVKEAKKYFLEVLETKFTS